MNLLLLPLWFALDLLAALVVYLLCLAGFWATPLLARWSRNSCGTPVLLVHGFAMGRGSLLLLGARLARSGAGPLAAISYCWLAAPERAVQRITDAAQRLAQSSGSAHVDIVAHSLGGLLSRRAREGASGRCIRRIVTLGTPHRGAWVHALPIGPMAQVIRPGAFGPAEDHDLAIGSRGDLLIPWHRCTLDPPASTLTLSGSGHAGLLLDPRMAQATAQHLASASTRSQQATQLS